MIHATPEAFAEFLRKDGAVGMLFSIDPENGSLFGEIEEQVLVSQTTLSNRIDQAKGMGLIVRTRFPDDHGNAKRYMLTPEAEYFREEMDEIGMVDAYDQYVEAQRILEDGVDEIEALFAEMEWQDITEINYKFLKDELS